MWCFDVSTVFLPCGLSTVEISVRLPCLFKVTFNGTMQSTHLHCADWACIPIGCVRVRVPYVCLGHISLSSSTVELLFHERVIPALIESRCSLSLFNGLPVIIRSFFWASKNSEVQSSSCSGAYLLSQCWSKRKWKSPHCHFKPYISGYDVQISYMWLPLTSFFPSMLRFMVLGVWTPRLSINNRKEEFNKVGLNDIGIIIIAGKI